MILKLRLKVGKDSRPVVSPRFLVKNDQIFEVGIFLLFMSVGVSACRKTPMGT